MTKKIKPKNQTEELNRAKSELLKRNPEELKEILKLMEKNEKGLDEYATRMATISGECNQELKKSWKFFLSEAFFDKDYKAKVLDTETFPACNAMAYQAGFMSYIHSQLAAYGGEKLPYMSKDATNGQYFMTKDALNEQFLDFLCKHARDIFTELTSAQPMKHLLVGIDLSRTKEVILAEVAEQVTRHQDRTGLGLKNTPQKRFKWLSIVAELLQIWDAWAGYGQRRCLSLIAKKMKMPESTVRARWRLAYRLIKGHEYSKEVAAASADELCARCKDQGKCYRTNKKGSMDFFPCAEYLKLTGKSCTREKLLENFDAVADMQAFQAFPEPEEEPQEADE